MGNIFYNTDGSLLKNHVPFLSFLVDLHSLSFPISDLRFPPGLNLGYGSESSESEPQGQKGNLHFSPSFLSFYGQEGIQ